MAIPVARVHLKVAHAALPALLPTPPKWNMLPQAQLPTPCVAVIFSKPGRADAVERWDARKTRLAGQPASTESSRKNATSPPPPKPCRADAVERWDAHKNAASPVSSLARSSKYTIPISRATSAERWDVPKKCCPPQAKLLDGGESRSTGSSDIDDTEEQILWKPRAMYAGPGFVVAAPESSMFPMPTSFLVPVA